MIKAWIVGIVGLTSTLPFFSDCRASTASSVSRVVSEVLFAFVGSDILAWRMGSGQLDDVRKWSDQWWLKSCSE